MMQAMVQDLVVVYLLSCMLYSASEISRPRC